ncbi:ThuA domain-containing protein [uncultured Cyclobacterium sp.]|uniref:ThuA domain-containing protein n=1 Tax=uncultured Cyclobacterium sp. TaxID=453820 RepID=UPI0030EC3330|tara:strand:+ start:123991 stop:124767 length:777 start_codon:yes stop_codon:yes gene_type:complete
MIQYLPTLSIKFLFLLLLLLPVSVFAQKNKVLIVSDTWPEMEVLSEGLVEKGYLVSKTSEEELQSDLSGFDFVFMYVHVTHAPRTTQVLIDYTMNGGSLVVLHHGISSSKMKNPQWLDFLGIALYPRDHQEYPWKVLANLTYSMVNLNPGHFISSNEMDYENVTTFKSEYETNYEGEYSAFQLVNTELFLNQRFTEDQRTILYGFRTEDGSRIQPTSGWYSKKGKGMVFYYQAGHAASDYQNPNFHQVILNTLEWDPS